MAYKKPQMVAKAVAKKSYVAGCPAMNDPSSYCNSNNGFCMRGLLK